MKLTYTLGKAYRERQFVETGDELDPTASVELPADALTPALRAHLVRTVGVRVPAEFVLQGYGPGYDGVGIHAGGRITLDAPASDGDALRLLAEDAQRWEAAEVRRVVKAAERAEERARAEAEARTQAERRQAAALAEAEERTRREAEKQAWIEAHGSAFLKKACLQGGYDCQRRYVEERAALERPGYVVDWKDAAAWKDRACPSEAALDEALAAGGTVVWLTAPANAGEDDYDFEPCEAVAIRGYLGKYDLIKAL